MINKVQQPKFEGPADEIIISDLETLKVLSDPLRMQIIELMGHQPRTVKQIAKQLEITSNKLYYHIKLLEDHGFIRVVKTRLVSGIVEKHYQTAAKDISVADGLLSVSKLGEGEVGSLIANILEGTKADFKRSLRARPNEEATLGDKHCSNVSREMARLTPEQAKYIRNKLVELVKEFESYHDEQDDEERQTFALTTLFYPSYSLEATLDSRDVSE
jgi:DNA-binding transcriptional ArsR family regulator